MSHPFCLRESAHFHGQQQKKLKRLAPLLPPHLYEHQRTHLAICYSSTLTSPREVPYFYLSFCEVSGFVGYVCLSCRYHRVSPGRLLDLLSVRKSASCFGALIRLFPRHRWICRILWPARSAGIGETFHKHPRPAWRHRARAVLLLRFSITSLGL